MTHLQLGHKFKSIALLAKSALAETPAEARLLESRAAAYDGMSRADAPARPDVGGIGLGVIEEMLKNMGRR